MFGFLVLLISYSCCREGKSKNHALCVKLTTVIKATHACKRVTKIIIIIFNIPCMDSSGVAGR